MVGTVARRPGWIGVLGGGFAGDGWPRYGQPALHALSPDQDTTSGLFMRPGFSCARIQTDFAPAAQLEFCNQIPGVLVQLINIKGCMSMQLEEAFGIPEVLGFRI